MGNLDVHVSGRRKLNPEGAHIGLVQWIEPRTDLDLLIDLWDVAHGQENETADTHEFPLQVVWA